MNYKNKILLNLLFLFGISIFGKSSLRAQDETKPIPICVANATVLMNDNSIKIFAKYFDRESFDEGTASSELRFTYSDIAPEQDPDYNEAEKSSSKVFSFPNDTSIEVSMYVWDIQGNFDYCTIELNLQESTGTSNSTVNGQLIYKGDPIEIESGVDITLKNIFDNGISNTINTTSLFEFDVPAGTYKLSAYNDKEHIEGVSTYDLVIIMKHILQIKQFDNPYSYFAADIRKDDEINALDIIQLRGIILGVIDSFPQNTSWRFGNAMQVFDSIPDALAIGLEEDVILSLDQDTSITRNFIPIKTGDVNHSNIHYGIHNGIDDNQQLIEPEYSSIIDFSRNDDYNNYSLRNDNDTVSFNIEEYHIEPGQEICISVTVKNFTDIAGFQFPISWDKRVLTLKSINKTNSLNGSGKIYFSDRYSDEGEVFAIWSNNAGEKSSLEDGTELFKLCFNASQSTPVYNTSLDFKSSHGFKAGTFDFLNPVPLKLNPGRILVDEDKNFDCIHHLSIEIDTNDTIEVTADMLLEDSQIDNSLYSVQIFSDPSDSIPQNDNIIDYSDYAKTYYARVTDIQTEYFCTSILSISCNTEFTLNNIQWPCNMELSVCDSLALDFAPDNLVFIGANSECVKPKTNNDCAIISTSYEDKVFYVEDFNKILRKWTIYDWKKYDPSLPNEGIFTHTQIIIINFNNDSESFICDTLPWNMPVGDCDSGHTLDDDVEWPADIVVNSLNITPNNLKHNTNIHPNDVEPLIINRCNNYKVSFTDEKKVLNDSSAIVERKWEVFDGQNNLYYYTQKIEVKARLYKGGVCTYTENNYPISDVEVINGVYTSEDGCVSLENIAQNTIITPKKDDDWKSGLDYLDVITLRKYILGQISLSPYQRIAADINESGSVSSLDLVLLEKVILGTYEPPVEVKLWKFVDAKYQFPIDDNVPINYPSTIKFDTSDYNQSFIGIKMGDLDNSNALGNAISGLKKTNISSLDEILNKGEYYDVDILSNGNFNVEGIQLELEIISKNIELINLSSDILKDFSVSNNVVIENDRIKILYFKDYNINDNYLVEPGSVLFTLRLKAKQNSILHESLALNNNASTNILKSINEDLPYQLIMKWENKILNKSVELSSNFDIKLYPQPASENIYVKLKNSSVQNVNFVIKNIVGEKVQNGTLNNNMIGISHLKAGLYFINFYDKDCKIATKKIIVSR